MTMTLLQSAFHATGIYPLNQDIFKSVDFAPSKLFSTTASTPSSYPEEVPSSPLAIPTDNELMDTDMEGSTDRDEEMEINLNEGSDKEDLDFKPDEPDTADRDSDTETGAPST
jgi:hypothetical protein